MKTQYTYIDMLEKVMDIARDKAEADGYDFPYSLFNAQDRDYITSAFQTFKKQEEAKAAQEKQEAETLRLLKNPPRSKRQLLEDVVRLIDENSYYGHRYPGADSEMGDVKFACQELLDGEAENDNELIYAIQDGPDGCDTDSSVWLEHCDKWELRESLDELNKLLVQVYDDEEEVA